MVVKNLSPGIERSRAKESQKNGEKILKASERFQICFFLVFQFQMNLISIYFNTIQLKLNRRKFVSPGDLKNKLKFNYK